MNCTIEEQECCNLKNLKIENALLYIDYIFLDKEERIKFAQCNHEYLIEQVQIHSESLDVNSNTNKIYLEFNHPIKELVWVFQSDDAFIQRRHTGMELFNFNGGVSNNPIASDDCGYFHDYPECQNYINKCICCEELEECCKENKTTIPILEPTDPMVEAIIKFEGNDRIL